MSYDKLLPPSQACVSFFRMRFIVRYRRGQDTCVDRGNLANECRYTHTLRFVLPYEYLDQSSLKPAVGLLCLVYRSLLPCLQVSFVGIDPCPAPVGHMMGKRAGQP